ncbi:MAG: DUF423 domain-containing protein [Microscillaceae bacterium]|nr:DUF423 domain-containing protein [Microscillaceae bacterium]MDW8460891.1 DUF423 domain-containing protein [Cytophagales bacterium]
MEKKYLLLTVGILGSLAVTIGAFGAHGLKEILAQNGYTEVFQTANRYHFYHTFALALLYSLPQTKLSKWATWGFLIGIIIFSGSLYLLAITKIKWLGAIAPVGGLAFIVAWLLLGLSLANNKN